MFDEELERYDRSISRQPVSEYWTEIPLLHDLHHYEPLKLKRMLEGVLEKSRGKKAISHIKLGIADGGSCHTACRAKRPATADAMFSQGILA